MLKPCDLVLADEPTGSLDTTNGDLVLAMLRELNAGGKTMITVAHDDHVAAACDRVNGPTRPSACHRTFQCAGEQDRTGVVGDSECRVRAGHISRNRHQDADCRPEGERSHGAENRLRSPGMPGLDAERGIGECIEHYARGATAPQLGPEDSHCYIGPVCIASCTLSPSS